MNNTAKHTPGPWYPHCAEADHCLSSSVWGAEPGNQVAVIGGKKLDEMNANAHLIAAAPAMYEALKAIPDSALNCEHQYPHTYACWNCIVKAALAQAKGK